MIDIHNHILYGIDDGAKNKEETLLLLQMAYSKHIESLIVTPHFVENKLENTKSIIEARFESVKQLIREFKIPIEIYPGCEIFLTQNTVKLLNQGIIQTMNNTAYILIETHRTNDFMTFDLREELYNLSVDGYKVILAHIERYQFTSENLSFIEQLISDGHYMQVNARSIDPKSPYHKLVKKLLDNQYVHFIASDAHDPIKRPIELDKANHFITNKYGEHYAKQLFFEHANLVLHNEEIPKESLKKSKHK